MVDTAPGTAHPHQPLVKVERLSVDFGRNRVLREITLNVARGETVADLINETLAGMDGIGAAA